jgi:hypothetical protein
MEKMKRQRISQVSSLKMAAEYFSETFVTVCHAVQSHNSEGDIPLLTESTLKKLLARPDGDHL